jgi:hypothetical protein
MPLLHSPSSGESFFEKPPKAQNPVRTLRQKDWQALLKEAFLAGERPTPSGSTEGASGALLNRARRQSLR